jgi:integrase
MATIVRRPGPNGQQVYRAQVRRKGHPSLSATFTKLSDARKWVQVTEAAILEGRHLPTAEAKRHTLADAIDRYLADVLPHKSAPSIEMQTIQLRWWRARLGHCLLAELAPALIAEHRDTLARGEGVRRENSTVRRYLAALSHALTVAVKEWGWLDDSPMRKVTKPREPRGRVRFLSDQERCQLLRACQASRNPYLHTIVLLALATGARRGELLGLRWPDVDLRRGTLTFHETKNGERRAVPLTGQALALIGQHARIRRLDTTLVFPNATGGRPLGIRDAFEGAVERAGIKDFRFHDLRHTAASYLAMSGASLAEIAEVLGHKTLAMVKRYAHLSEAHTRGVVERMNRAVFGE